MKEKKQKKPEIKVTQSSGNVFTDMGLANPEERLLKAKLARLVNKAIATKGWTQTVTAQVLGITQPDVSELSRGRLKNFSVERLIYFLSKLDKQVIISVSGEGGKAERDEIIVAAQKSSFLEAHAPQKV